MTKVLLRPRAYANLLREESGKYRYRMMPGAAGGIGIYFPDGTAYGSEPTTDDNRAEAEEVLREATAEMIRAGETLAREYERAKAEHAKSVMATNRAVDAMASGHDVRSRWWKWWR